MIGWALSRRSVASAPEYAQVTAPGGPIAVAVRINPRAKRISLRLAPDGSPPCLTLPSPRHLSRGLAFAQTRADWLATQMDMRAGCMRPFVPGAVVPFNGQPLLLATGSSRLARRIENRLEVGGDPALFSARVQRWMRAEARHHLSADTMALAAAHNLDIAAIRIGDPRSRWGSCAADGRIAFSWRLMLAPVDVRAAVVAHEVAHLVHRNHGPDFWALATRLLGQSHQPARAWLRRHGPELHGWGAVPPLSEA